MQIGAVRGVTNIIGRERIGGREEPLPARHVEQDGFFGFDGDLPDIFRHIEVVQDLHGVGGQRKPSADLPQGRSLLKQVRMQLVETARPALEAMVENITEVKVVSLHYDVSTTTGEAVILFTLTESPFFREAKRG